MPHEKFHLCIFLKKHNCVRGEKKLPKKRKRERETSAMSCINYKALVAVRRGRK